jgi:hypothetical protein
MYMVTESRRRMSIQVNTIERKRWTAKDEENCDETGTRGKRWMMRDAEASDEGGGVFKR